MNQIMEPTIVERTIMEPTKQSIERTDERTDVRIMVRTSEGGAHVCVRRREGDGAERERYSSALVGVLRAGDQRQVRRTRG